MSVEEQATKILRMAVEQRLTDLYFLPVGQQYQIKKRTSTGIELWQMMTRTEVKPLLNHLKYSAKMSLSETRRPQLGARTLKMADSTVFLRLSTVGNFENLESMVIRFIYAYADTNQFIFPQQLTQLQQLSQQRGLMLFAGPTGSGKTTTLYRIARQNAQEKIVMAIEDPIEIYENNFLQLQVNEQANMTYAELLKVSLRHRPDIFIIGEIRDEQTAAAAIRAALSGHLVLSTVHARSATGVIKRLTDFKIDQETLKDCLTSVCYQRILPTEKKQAAILFDLLSNQILAAAFNGKTPAGWPKLLEQAWQDGIISSETVKAYQNG
ncbi:competence type IV pilus ATPase ComGA [Loigolactobacillus backii]|uniref:Competence protein ComGA n=1 Tax=Loigolactobacillus backii TaxID=375175 RepID=A0A192H4G8_9LACO|nr:competence type IV pilus ATPase ComGA [Loigolactobacillus backii]ANK59934.1 competence protein ComGA [Loigolactobacillus backii]ANK63270.1 competence protein ComGA [Loigolactobacillus backii]ANK64868.1 competence protein ComGA [Loigolactobacillus backii]ANK66685.1 competence protein ComGA [Loigolactobacillus backii]ANK69724.1 competence protein ComGA [Loigolactobacillus backii]